jgi:large conductance mechanosensitive channel
MEVALGLIIGSAFSNVVNSLVTDVLLPPLSLISPNSRNLESHFLILRGGDTADAIYNTIEQAAADGKICESTLANCFRSDLSGLGAFPTEGIN